MERVIHKAPDADEKASPCFIMYQKPQKQSQRVKAGRPPVIRSGCLRHFIVPSLRRSQKRQTTVLTRLGIGMLHFPSLTHRGRNVINGCQL